jgi:uncharacterized protein (TIGR02611 family)
LERDEVPVDNTPNVSSSDHSGQGARSRGPVHRRLHANPALALTTKLVVGMVGTAVLLVGVVMLVTPGPAFVMIPVGLAILATEFDWAHRWLQAARKKAHEARLKAQSADPRVRRRRRLLLALVLVLVVGAVVAYVAAFGWPAYAVDGWDWVQSVAHWAPELPGM